MGRHRKERCCRSPATRAPSVNRWPGASGFPLRPASSRIQTRLELGAPGDFLEREADRLADAVMRAPAPGHGAAGMSTVQRVPAGGVAGHATGGERIQRSTENPIDQGDGLVLEEEEGPWLEEETVQAKEQAGTAPRLSPEVAASVEALRGGGEPLEPAVRSFMEPRLGHDFSQVRIHTGERAARAADALGARAFTLGRDVAFAAGQYAPATDSGRWLLAHELTHVVQQDAAATGPAPAAGTIARAAGPETIRRVAWNPHVPTGRRSYPWGSGPVGPVLRAATDAGTPLDIWREAPPGTTYWCHGYTFGGSTAAGGPYSLWGSDVPLVLNDDGWRRVYSCLARRGDILVFHDEQGRVTHSGIIRSVSSPRASIDERASTLQSKWGSGSLNTQSWSVNAASYGMYRAYSKSPAVGPCATQGRNELP